MARLAAVYALLRDKTAYQLRRNAVARMPTNICPDTVTTVKLYTVKTIKLRKFYLEMKTKIIVNWLEFYQIGSFVNVDM